MESKGLHDMVVFDIEEFEIPMTEGKKAPAFVFSTKKLASMLDVAMKTGFECPF